MDKPTGRKWAKGNLPDFLTLVKKRAQMTPSPVHYQKNVQLIGRSKKFYMSKLPRTTEIDLIFKRKKDGPSPASYNPKEIRSTKKLFQSKLERNGFIEDAKARAGDSPPPYDAKYTLTEPRMKGRQFLPTKKDLLGPIKKINSGPECCTYTIDNAYNKTVKRVKIASISKYNLPLIQDMKVKLKGWVPGAGAYKWENSYDKTTRPPMFKKGKY